LGDPRILRSPRREIMRTIALAVVFSTVLATHTARANDFLTGDDKTMDSASTDTPAPKDPVDGPAAKSNDSDNLAPPIKLAPSKASLAGVSALRSMYGSLGLLQAYDVYSTKKAMATGAIERNPLLQGTVANRAAFIGLKVAMTAGPIYEAEKLWRSHHRMGAIALMAASNGIMMGVAAHNASIIRKAEALQSVR
jgi:hypothetical protein